MDKDAVIAILRAHRAELEALGVRHAALFGSVARGEAGPQSDIDIAVDFDASNPPGVFAFVGLAEFIGGLFSERVDVVDTQSLRGGRSRSAMADIVDAF